MKQPQHDRALHPPGAQERAEIERIEARRTFLKGAAAGTLVMAFGGAAFAVAADDDPRLGTNRPDGRPRLPPGQRLLSALRPMGGEPGDPSAAAWRCRIHGDCDRPTTIDFATLLRMPQTSLRADVHCVTGWTVFDAPWTGVRLSHLAELAGVRPGVRHVVFEAAHGYTANVPLREALRPNVMLAHRLNGAPLPRPHGPPVRSLVPDLYFWKSAKWLTGVRFVRADEPGYWETRGDHNHGDPWREERYG